MIPTSGRLGQLAIRREDGTFLWFSKPLSIGDIFIAGSRAAVDAILPLIEGRAELTTQAILGAIAKQGEETKRSTFNALVNQWQASQSFTEPRHLDANAQVVFTRAHDVLEHLSLLVDDSARSLMHPSIVPADVTTGPNAWRGEKTKAEVFAARALIFLHAACIYIDAKAHLDAKSFATDHVIARWTKWLEELTANLARRAIRVDPNRGHAHDSLVLSLALARDSRCVSLAQFVGDERPTADLFVNAFDGAKPDHQYDDCGREQVLLSARRRKPFQDEVELALLLCEVSRLATQARGLVESLSEGEFKDRDSLREHLGKLADATSKADWPNDGSGRIA
jgi:hypothetical protein